MIRNYIFDLYGTLVDIRTDETMPSLWRRMALMLSLQGADYDSETLRRAYLAAVNEQIDKRMAAHPSVARQHIEPDILPAFEALYKGKGILPGEEKVKDTAIFFRTVSMRHIRLYPHVKKLLRDLRSSGKGVYLLSNAQAAFTMPELNRFGLVPLFDGIVLSSEAGVKKPDAALFEYLFSKYGLHPETCLMVGNDAEADMLGAASVGMQGRYIHTKQSPCLQGHLPEGCRSIQDLTDLLSDTKADPISR